MQAPDSLPEEILVLDWLAEVKARRDGCAHDLLLTVRAPKTRRYDRLNAWCTAQGFAIERPEFTPLEEARLDIAQPPEAGQAVRLCASGHANAREYPVSPAPWLQQSLIGPLPPMATRIVAEGEAAAPAAVQPILFPGSDGMSGAPRHSYALIDANRFFGLAQVLENSGLRHRCLFKGEAAQKFADSAPYLIELLPRHPFTRRLFTQSMQGSGDAPWTEQAVSFLISPLSLDGLHAHLRLFTQLWDGKNGRTVFFRFFAPEVLRTVIPALPPPQLAKFTRGLSHFVCPDPDGAAILLEVQHAATAQA